MTIRVFPFGTVHEERFIWGHVCVAIFISFVSQGMVHGLAFLTTVYFGSNRRDVVRVTTSGSFVEHDRTDKLTRKVPTVSLILSNVSFTNLVVLEDMLVSMARENQIF